MNCNGAANPGAVLEANYRYEAMAVFPICSPTSSMSFDQTTLER
jgi:hypothetical protein